MKKLIYTITILFLCCIVVPMAFAANEWREGTGADTLLGSESVSDIDARLYQDVTDPLDRLLNKYIRGASLSWLSVSSLTLAKGEIACQNTAGNIVRFRQNTSDLTLTWADIDTGAEANLVYYVYGVCDADAETFTAVISANSSTPDAGAATYYKQIGSFENVAGDIVDTSIEAPDEVPDVAIETVYNYGTSSSSYTTKTTGILVAYGTASFTGDTTVTISSLPFSSTSTYSCAAERLNAGYASQNIQMNKLSASTMKMTDFTTSSAAGWICIGY